MRQNKTNKRLTSSVVERRRDEGRKPCSARGRRSWTPALLVVVVVLNAVVVVVVVDDEERRRR